MNIKLSFIVPVYNTGEKLNSLLSSLNQIKENDIEVVIIDDGSTDLTTIQALDKYDDSFRIVHKSNEGVSKTRNLGIELVSGKYIAFIDSDDLLIVEEFLKIRELLDKDYDLICFNYKKNNQDYIFTNANCEINNQEYLCSLFDGDIYNGYIWNKIIKRDILINNKIQFNEKVYYNEDRLFCMQLGLNAKTIYHSDIIYYDYIDNPNGAMSKGKLLNDKTKTEFYAFDECIKLSNDQNLTDLIAREAYYNALTYYFLKSNRKAAKPFIKKYYKCIKKKTLKDIIKYHFKGLLAITKGGMI